MSAFGNLSAFAMSLAQDYLEKGYSANRLYRVWEFRKPLAQINGGAGRQINTCYIMQRRQQRGQYLQARMSKHYVQVRGRYFEPRHSFPLMCHEAAHRPRCQQSVSEPQQWPDVAPRLTHHRPPLHKHYCGTGFWNLHADCSDQCVLLLLLLLHFFFYPTTSTRTECGHSASGCQRWRDL